MSEISEFLESHRVSVEGLEWSDYLGNAPGVRTAKAVTWGLLHADEMRAAGVSVPTGMLITGMPGGGKTHLARVMASVMGRTAPAMGFYEINATELDAERVRAVGRELADPDRLSVVFVDEADLFISDRDSDTHTDETLATLIALLQVLDGLAARPGAVWILAASLPLFKIDDAICRPGRASYIVSLELPKLAEIRALLEYFLVGLPVAGGIDLDRVAELLGSATPARLRQVVSQAYLFALDAGRETITDDDLMSAVTAGRDRYGQVRTSESDILRFGSVGAAAQAIVGARLGVCPSSLVVGVSRFAADFETGMATVPLTDSIVRDVTTAALAAWAGQKILCGDELSEANEHEGLGERLVEMRIGSGLVAGLPLFRVRQHASSTAEADAFYVARMSEIRAARLRAEGLVAELRAPIEALAARLLAERSLSGARLEAALDELLPGRPAPRVPVVKTEVTKSTSAA